MDVPFRERLHKAVSGDSEEAGDGAVNEAAEDGAANKAAVSLALTNRRCSRFFSTKKMRAWIGLPCYMAKLSSSAEFEYYPVGVFLDDEAPKARVDSPGEIDTYCRIHLDIKLLLPSLRRFTRLDRGAEHSSILGKFTRWELAARHSKREPDHSREYRPALRRFTGWRKRLFGTYLATFPKRSVTIECAVELHKHSPDSSGLGLYFLRELRIIMSSRMELRREETLMATLITDFLLVAPWVHPYSESEERRVDVRRSLLTDRLENVGWQGSVIHPPKAPSNPKAESN
jgi:hypothetical protein